MKGSAEIVVNARRLSGADSLALMDRASQLLFKAKTLQEAKELRDIALTARDWARRRRKGIQAVQNANACVILCEDRIGEFLIHTERAKGGKPYQKSTSTPTPRVEVEASDLARQPTLKELGITWKESVTAQFVHSLPDDIKQLLVLNKITKREAMRRAKRKMAYEKVGTPNEISGKFRVVLSDPPWQYVNSGLADYGHAEAHYPTMSLAELCALPVKDLVEENAVLFLWATAPMLEAPFQVISAWGFEYKANFVWDKSEP